MIQQHTLPANLLTRPIKVLLVGAGGTGSRMLERLACLHKAIRAKGHPAGLDVTVVDPDTVSPANIGRQAFYPGDVGAFKADVLVNRVNMFLGDVAWKSVPERLDTRANLSAYDLVIGAVDNRAARLGILRGLEAASGGVRYWLDIGNRKADGQVILGQVSSRKKVKEDLLRLPHIGELYPELIDPKFEDNDDTPSCSLAQALEKQSLFINPTVADVAASLLWELFTKGQIDIHGAFVNLERMTVSPLRVDPDTWGRFGVRRDGRRHRVHKPSTLLNREYKRAQTQNTTVTSQTMAQ